MTDSRARLIIDRPRRGALNMAVDQTLLETTDESKTPVLRFYGWSAPTLSLGYFQKHATRRGHKASRKCKLVRRASGGGAIVHDRELTYSLCLPSVSRWSKQNRELYEIAHQEIIGALNARGIESRLIAELPPVKSASSSPGTEPFLCFERRAAGDIVIGTTKICGSAQRRLRNSLIQHGSILFAKSKFAPELEGTRELTGIEIDSEEFCLDVALRLSERLKIQFEVAQLSQKENDRSHELAALQFGHKQWTYKR